MRWVLCPGVLISPYHSVLAPIGQNQTRQKLGTNACVRGYLNLEHGSERGLVLLGYAQGTLVLRLTLVLQCMEEVVVCSVEKPNPVVSMGHIIIIIPMWRSQHIDLDLWVMGDDLLGTTYPALIL
ncbi:hypothetical protein M434DRAFT_11743 [Hypoxylon sp. CO27-5]|nr:hypothetical protein M434DRAFT_11743 [Hypoxylon sp. CO27-5]